MRLATAVIIAALLGCVCVPHNGETQNQYMASWVGRNIHEAVSTFGQPSSTYPNGDTVIYEWNWIGASHATAGGSRYFVGSSAWTDSCRRWFDVRDEMIIGWHWQGRC